MARVAKQRRGGPNWTLDVERESIPIIEGPGPVLDEKWRHTDARGHEHTGASGLPTLSWVQDEPDWVDADGDEHNGEGHYECRLCGEHIQPGSRPPDPWVKYLPGMTTATLTIVDGNRTSRYSLSPNDVDIIRVGADPAVLVERREPYWSEYRS